MTDTPDATPAEAITEAAINAFIAARPTMAAAIAARATAEPRWHCTADPATVPCGRCVACRCDHVDAYQAGRVAERERILGRATECKTCGEVHPGCLAYDDGHPYQPRWAYPDSTLMDRLADLLGGAS